MLFRSIMGFGGGAFIASPLSVWLMQKFSTPTHLGIAQTFLILGAGYFVFMMIGAALVGIPLLWGVYETLLNAMKLFR